MESKYITNSAAEHTNNTTIQLTGTLSVIDGGLWVLLRYIIPYYISNSTEPLGSIE